jgi:PAS domain-containing protein
MGSADTLLAADNARLRAKRAAQQASETRGRTSVETAREGIWQIDAESCTTYVNHRKRQEDDLRQLLTGASSYIVKPVDSDPLLMRLGQVGLYWLHLNRSSCL